MSSFLFLVECKCTSFLMVFNKFWFDFAYISKHRDLQLFLFSSLIKKGSAVFQKINSTDISQDFILSQKMSLTAEVSPHE